MHINLDGRRLYYDLVGPDTAPVVCFTHSLASDGGMWAEQLPPLLAAGYRVLRLDMRGHGGSDAVAGDYTMTALSDDVAASLDFLGIQRVHFCGLSIGANAWPRRCCAIPRRERLPAPPRRGRRASRPSGRQRP